jgi:hypothetical protein
MEVHAYNPSPREAQALGGWWVQGQPELQSENLSKKTNDKNKWNNRGRKRMSENKGGSSSRVKEISERQ